VLQLEADDGTQVPVPDSYDLLVFVSGFAVDCYFQALERQGIQQWSQGVYGAAVGEATAQALKQTGLLPDNAIVAPSAESAQDSEALWDVLQKRNLDLKRVLIVCGNSGRDWLSEQLSAAGVCVQRYHAYTRKPAQWQPVQLQKLQELAVSQHKVIVLLTSSQGVDAWLAGMRQADLMALVPHADFVVLHERIALHLRQGIQHLFQDAKPTIIVSKPDDETMFRSIMMLAST